MDCESKIQHQRERKIGHKVQEEREKTITFPPTPYHLAVDGMDDKVKAHSSKASSEDVSSQASTSQNQRTRSVKEAWDDLSQRNKVGLLIVAVVVVTAILAVGTVIFVAVQALQVSEVEEATLHSEEMLNLLSGPFEDASKQVKRLKGELTKLLGDRAEMEHKLKQVELNYSKAIPDIKYYLQQAFGFARSQTSIDDPWRYAMNGFKYQFVQQGMSWKAAREFCKKQDADLVDKKLDNFPFRRWIAETILGSAGSKVYIGLREEGNEWKWIDNSTATVSVTWIDDSKLEPEQGCAVLHRNNGHYSFENEFCSTSYASICEAKIEKTF